MHLNWAAKRLNSARLRASIRKSVSDSKVSHSSSTRPLFHFTICEVRITLVAALAMERMMETSLAMMSFAHTRALHFNGHIFAGFQRGAMHLRQ